MKHSIKILMSAILVMLVAIRSMALCSPQHVVDSDNMATTNQSKTMGKINIQVNGKTMKATLVDNSSTAALVELLRQGPLTYSARDYGNFEKVGHIGHNLPRNDEYISTVPGDIILYQGSNICIYYDTNEWDFTRLGRIDNLSPDEIRSILGTGDCTITLSLDGATAVTQVENGNAKNKGKLCGLDGKTLREASTEGMYIENGIKKSRR